MKNLCPSCGSTLATDDTYFYTCLECDEIYTADDLAEEYGIDVGCSGCELH